MATLGNIRNRSGLLLAVIGIAMLAFILGDLMQSTSSVGSKNIIYVMSSGGQPTASNAACLLATQSAQSGRNVLLCDTTGQSEKQIKEITKETDNGSKKDTKKERTRARKI